MANHFIIQRENTQVHHFSIFITFLITLLKVQRKTTLLLVYFSRALKLGPVFQPKGNWSPLLPPTQHILEKGWGPWASSSKSNILMIFINMPGPTFAHCIYYFWAWNCSVFLLRPRPWFQSPTFYFLNIAKKGCSIYDTCHVTVDALYLKYLLWLRWGLICALTLLPWCSLYPSMYQATLTSHTCYISLYKDFEIPFRIFIYIWKRQIPKNSFKAEAS